MAWVAKGNVGFWAAVQLFMLHVHVNRVGELRLTGLSQNKQANLIWDPSSPKNGPKTKPGTSETHRGPRGNVPVAYVPGISIWGSIGVLEAAHFRPRRKAPRGQKWPPAPVISPFVATQLPGRAWAVTLIAGGRQGCDMGLISALSTPQGPSAVPIAVR